MRRGQRTIATVLSGDTLVSSTKSLKGIFKNDRDEALAYRYYYYDYLCHIKYQTAIARLSLEFYISETVVTQILTKQIDLLKKLKAEKAEYKHLKKKYPYYNWAIVTIGE